MNQGVQFILERLKERTTYLGIFAFLGSMGVVLPTGISEQVIGAGIAIVSIILMLMKEDKTKSDTSNKQSGFAELRFMVFTSLLALVFIFYGCASNSPQQEATWSAALDHIEQKIDAGKVDRDEAIVLKAAIQSYALAADEFNESPQINACKMAQAMEIIAPLAGVPVPASSIYCVGTPLTEDMLEAELEAQKEKNRQLGIE